MPYRIDGQTVASAHERDDIKLSFCFCGEGEWSSHTACDAPFTTAGLA
jgi:hypothetical protein